MTVNMTTVVADVQRRLALFADQQPVGVKGNAVTCADPWLATAIQTHFTGFH